MFENKPRQAEIHKLKAYGWKYWLEIFKSSNAQYERLPINSSCELYAKGIKITDSVFIGVLETNNTNLKCKCIRKTVNFFPIYLIERLNIIPRGRGCPNTEIM